MDGIFLCQSCLHLYKLCRHGNTTDDTLKNSGFHYFLLRGITFYSSKNHEWITYLLMAWSGLKGVICVSLVINLLVVFLIFGKWPLLLGHGPSVGSVEKPRWLQISSKSAGQELQGSSPQTLGTISPPPYVRFPLWLLNNSSHAITFKHRPQVWKTFIDGPAPWLWAS